MTHLSTDVLTLSHTAITLIAIFSGLVVVAQMLKSSYRGGWTGVFLATTLLTSVTGFVFFHPPHPPTPAQSVGVVALLVLAVTLVALYLKHLAGVWRPIYIVGALISLWLNVFVGIIQSLQKIPSPFQFAEGAPPGGPVFAALQTIALIAFLVAGWKAWKNFHPLNA
ncbi:MAG: hypothetical protein JWP16_1187 [Alphaproteobacteria bacterium]|jgi:hypothetical protein|nr:hypothetical protein [Alphaproteobacteria bacterium]MDB5740147.1 hypothetical protein [Alphaproteobacteria bacterium]